MSSAAADRPLDRDLFTAVDVSVLIPLTFVIDAVQYHDRHQLVAALVTGVSVIAVLVIGLELTVSFGRAVLGAAAVGGVGWLYQVVHAIRRPPRDNTKSIACWAVSTVSAFHFVTLINTYHTCLRHDAFIRIGRRIVYGIHLTVGSMLAIMLLVMDELNVAWGCYPHGTSLRDMDRGPCGMGDVPWAREFPQPICRTAPSGCKPQITAAQMMDRPLHYAIHVETAAFALYCVMCYHAYLRYGSAACTTLDLSFLSASAPPSYSSLFQ